MNETSKELTPGEVPDAPSVIARTRKKPFDAGLNERRCANTKPISRTDHVEESAGAPGHLGAHRGLVSRAPGRSGIDSFVFFDCIYTIFCGNIYIWNKVGRISCRIWTCFIIDNILLA